MPILLTGYSREEFEELITDCVKKAMENVIRERQERNRDPGRVFMNIEDASKYLDLAKQTIYSFTCKGTIPFIKKAKKLYFIKADLDTWLSGNWQNQKQ